MLHSCIIIIIVTKVIELEKYNYDDNIIIFIDSVWCFLAIQDIS